MQVSPRLRTAMSLVVIAAIAAAGFLWMRHDSGLHWDDADVGQCLGRVPQVALASLLGHSGRLPVLDCSDPSANYVVVSRSATETDVARWTAGCPDAAADAVGTGHVRDVSYTGHSDGSGTLYGLMCLAPVLHVGRCYGEGDDRGALVSVDESCLPGSRRVTRTLPDVGDVQKCSPALGLALTTPQITYCEESIPMPRSVIRP